MNIITFFGFEITPEKYQYFLNIPKEKLLGWIEAGITILPNFVVAIITLLLFYPFAKFAKWLAGKIVKRTSDNVAVRSLFQNIVFLIVLMIGVFSALEILNLDKTVTSLLAGAGVIGLAMGFAFQEIASNFVSGILIAFRKPYRVGDIVEIQGRTGAVRSIELRTTSIMTAQGLEVIVPNKTMVTETLINYTSTPERRVELVVGISYQDDLEKVEYITRKAVENIPERMKDHEIEFFYQSFADSSIIFRLRFWIHYPGDLNFDRAIHNAIIRVKKAFDENGITIPYPIRTLESKNSNFKI
jgi:small conductance mechanosensitive channel